MEILEERRVIKDPMERKILGVGGCKSKSLPWGRYGYFLEPHIPGGGLPYETDGDECFYLKVVFKSIVINLKFFAEP